MKNITSLLLALTGMAAVALYCPQSASAQDGASGVVKQRIEAMKMMGGAMKQLAAMMKGQSPFDLMTSSQAGIVINEQAAGLSKLFPSGSVDSTSRAREEIWSKWTEFEAAAKALSRAGTKLENVDMDAGKKDVMILFAAIGKSCKTCHQSFRRPKDK